ncbi:hypothetical protein A2U01_0115452, partial [Trifolium medium]|nr:hypothetical protein [Trifolium medium]
GGAQRDLNDQTELNMLQVEVKEM